MDNKNSFATAATQHSATEFSKFPCYGSTTVSGNFPNNVATTLANQKIISLCIPRMEIETPKEYILNTLSKINMGKIIRIIEIPTTRDLTSKRVIVKLKINNVTTADMVEGVENKSLKNIFERLCSGENIKIVHNFPWYWKMMTTHPQKQIVKVLE
jgi:hypothetical protein